VSAFNLRFPGPKNFAPALAVVARVDELLNGLNRRWAVRYDFAAVTRQAPRTLHPRKGATPPQPSIAEVIGHFIRERDMFAMDASQVNAIGQVLVTDAVTGVATPLPWAVAAYDRIGKLDRIGPEAAYQRVRAEIMALGAVMPGAPGQ